MDTDLRPTVSVTIAVYKAEKYIERCARSLFGQTLQNMEFVFVDDATPDKSMDILMKILEEYPSRKKQVKIIRHKQNQGTYITKREGYLASTGEFTTVCDSDDWVELDAYEKAYKKAKEVSADIVIFNYIEHYADREVVKERSLPYERAGDVIANAWRTRFIFLLCDMLICNRHNVIRDLADIKGLNIGEDGYMCVNLFYALRNSKVAYLHDALYHYDITNGQSVTKNSTAKYFKDVSLVLMEFRKTLRPWDKYKMFVYSTMFHAKTSRFFSNDFKQWKNIFPESNQYVLKYTDLPLKVRVLYWLMLHGFGWLRKII